MTSSAAIRLPRHAIQRRQPFWRSGDLAKRKSRLLARAGFIFRTSEYVKATNPDNS
jgi:hypothetical protein